MTSGVSISHIINLLHKGLKEEGMALYATLTCPQTRPSTTSAETDSLMKVGARNQRGEAKMLRRGRGGRGDDVVQRFLGDFGPCINQSRISVGIRACLGTCFHNFI